jgi:hypothetical protein
VSANSERHCCANRNKTRHEHDSSRIAKESVARRGVNPADIQQSSVA